MMNLNTFHLCSQLRQRFWCSMYIPYHGQARLHCRIERFFFGSYFFLAQCFHFRFIVFKIGYENSHFVFTSFFEGNTGCCSCPMLFFLRDILYSREMHGILVLQMRLSNLCSFRLQLNRRQFSVRCQKPKSVDKRLLCPQLPFALLSCFLSVQEQL